MRSPAVPGLAARHLRPARSPHDAEILRLAIPAFGALIAEPLFLFADSAIVARLGTTPLGGLGVASQALSTVVGIAIFLAYGTTAAVARQLGAGNHGAAIRQGIDGLWLAAILGLLVLAAGWPAARAIAAAFGGTAGVTAEAATYLRISLLGVPSMLIMLAGAAAAYLAVVARGARRAGAALRPGRDGLRAAAVTGAALVVRTLALQAVLIVMTAIAARQGGAAIAAHQITFRAWALLAYALDAIAIAGQAITGRYLGAGDPAGARSATSRMIGWGVIYGTVFGVVLFVSIPVLPAIFPAAPDVRQILVPVLVVAALQQPIAGLVFVLDGVLIGAGDQDYLALAGLAAAAVFAAAVVVVVTAGHGGLVSLWLAFTVWLLARFATVTLRTRGRRWLVTGAVRP